MKYNPGKQNVLADTLSHRPDYEFAHVTTLSLSVTDLIHTSYAKEKNCVALLRAPGSKEFNDSDIELSARSRADNSMSESLNYIDILSNKACCAIAQTLRIYFSYLCTS